MNVCLIITNLSGGGAERATIDLSNALFYNGHRVTILLLEKIIAYKTPNHLILNSLQNKPPFLHGYIGKRVLARSLKKKWVELNEKFNFDLTISRLPFANEVVKLAHIPKPYFIVDTHLSDEIKKIKLKNRFKALRIKQRYQKIYEHNHLIAVSKNVAHDLKANFKNSNVHQIYNPINIDQIKIQSQIKNSKIPNFPYVIHIGRAIDAKRHDLILDAWSLTKTNCKLLMITDDVLKIKAMVKDRHLEKRVDVIGFQFNPYTFIANAKLLVLCSDFEGFGLVLIEASICNTPILSTNFGSAVTEIFGNRFKSHLSPRGNSFALAKNIQNHLSRKIISQPKIDLKRFSFNNISSQYEKLIKNKTVLFLKAKNIGDSIILTSAINALSDDYQYIDVVCFKESEDIFKMHPKVRHIFVIPRHLTGLSKLKGYWDFVKNISSIKYNLLVQFNHDWRGALIARSKLNTFKISRESDRRGKFWHHSFNFISPIKSERYPAAEQDLNILKSAHLIPSTINPKYTLIPPPEAQERAKQWIKLSFKRSKNKIILIHAAARWSFKQIPITTWAEVINRINQTEKVSIVLNGSEKDYAYNESIAKKCSTKPTILKAKSIIDSAAVMQQVDLVVSIDSMAIHLASALNKKIVGIYGPTDEANWAPWQTKYEIAALNHKYHPNFSCRPCGRDGCNGSKISDCLIHLPAEIILQKIRKLLVN